MPITGNSRNYLTSGYGIELDGLFGGSLYSAEGGDATADVVAEKIGPDGIIHKHLAGVKYEDIAIECGTGMSKGFYEWIAKTLELTFPRKNGAIITTGSNNQTMSRLEFYNGLISEIGFPALDAASKDAGKLTIKIVPETTRDQRNQTGTASASTSSQLGSIQQRWLCSNFRLQIAGLDCTRVNRIEALSIQQPVVANLLGESRGYQTEASHLDFSNVAITLTDSQAQSFYDWHEDFVIKGNNGQAMEKNGTLEFLTSDLKEVIFRLTLSNLGIFRLAREPLDRSGNIRRVRAEMYCNKMTLEYPSAVSGVSPVIATTEINAVKASELPLPSAFAGAPAPRTTTVAASLRFRT